MIPINVAICADEPHNVEILLTLVARMHILLVVCDVSRHPPASGLLTIHLFIKLILY